MTRWYKRHVGKTLAKAVEEALDVDPEQQLAVFEEIALIRESAGHFVGIHSKLIESGANSEALAASALAMQSALAQVVEVCTKATKAHDKMRQFSVHDIDHITMQLTSFLWEVCGEEHRDIAQQFLDHVQQHLTLPNKGSAAPTDLKPSDTVEVMDATVPYVPDDDDGTELEDDDDA